MDLSNERRHKGLKPRVNRRRAGRVLPADRIDVHGRLHFRERDDPALERGVHL